MTAGSQFEKNKVAGQRRIPTFSPIRSDREKEN